MAKKAWVLAASASQNTNSEGKSVKTYKNLKRKHKATGERQTDNQETISKKVRFSSNDRMAPEHRKRSQPEYDESKTQKREKQRLPRFMKPELRTIKKKGNIFEKVKPTASGKPNWTDIKKESLKLRKARKERKLMHFEIIIQIKKIWEVARHENYPVDKRAQDIIKLHSLVQNQLNKLVYAHDTSRIVQGLLKLGSPSVRKAICEELEPLFVEMMCNKFSSFIIKRLLQYGDDESKAKVLKSTKGNVIKLLANSASAPLVEILYTQVASPDQKMAMEREFLGSFLVTLQDTETGSIAKHLTELSAENKSAVFETVKENLIKVISKGNQAFSILCSVAHTFIELASEEDKQEILPLFCPHILEFVATKPGSRLGMQCILSGDKKARKQIVNKIKGHVTSLATSEYSFWVILTLLDTVDDTVLINKVVVSEIAENAITLLNSEYGRKVLSYLVAHRDPVFFHPKDVNILKKADSCCLKSVDTKREELSPVINNLLISISKEVETWMQNSKVAMITLATLKAGKGEKLSEALQVIASYVCSDAAVENKPLYENPGMNLILKKLLKVDDTRKDDSDKFSVHLATILKVDTIKKWISGNRGAFLLVGILEVKCDQAVKTLVSKLTRPLRVQICKEKNIGAKVLVRLLKEAAPDLDDWEALCNTDD